MRIIKRKTLAAYWRRHPQAEASLSNWYKLTKAATWICLNDVRETFPHADEVKVASGRTVVVFNIAGNKHRLIAALHYDRNKAFTLMVLTHAQYSTNRWKKKL